MEFIRQKGTIEKLIEHPAGSSVYQNIFWSINKYPIQLTQNNTAKLYLLRTAKLRMNYSSLLRCLQISNSVPVHGSSTIHKAAGSLVTGCSLQNGKNAGGRNDPQTLFPYSRLHGFSGIVPVKSWNGWNREAGGFVNSTVKPTNHYLQKTLTTWIQRFNETSKNVLQLCLVCITIVIKCVLFIVIRIIARK